MHYSKIAQSATLVQDDSQTNEAAELARFREEWKADLNQRLNRPDVTQKPPPTELTPAPEPTSPLISAVPQRTIKPVSPIVPTDSAPGPSRGPGFTAALSPAQENALALYRRAVAHEQKSELDDALLLYKQAFRVYEDIPRLYERLENLPRAVVRPVDEKVMLQQLHLDHKLVPVDPTAQLAHDMRKLHVSFPS